MIIKFETVKDLLSFIKMALYMTEKKAAKKMLKWKKSGELIIDEDDYTLQLHNNSEFDQTFIDSIQQKYNIWKKTNKLYTIDHPKPL